MATLRWHDGVDNSMAYVDGAIPVGASTRMRWQILGSGHGAIDSSSGCTYLNPPIGHDVSTALAASPTVSECQYAGFRSGVDFRFKWARQVFFSKQLFVGLIRYALSADLQRHGSASDPEWIHFAVFSIGPQIDLFRLENYRMSESKRLRRAMRQIDHRAGMPG